jgi:hypothetical protein
MIFISAVAADFLGLVTSPRLVEAAMKDGATEDVQRVCAEFLRRPRLSGGLLS